MEKEVYCCFRSCWTGKHFVTWLRSIFAVTGEPVHKCCGWSVPSNRDFDDLQLIRRRFSYSVSYCVGWSMTNQFPAFICLDVFHDILSKILLLYCLQTPPAHAVPAGKGTLPPLGGSNENLASRACRNSQHFYLQKMHHLVKKKAGRALWESSGFAVQKEISNQETTTT